MEALLLRLCEELSAKSGGFDSTKLEDIHRAVANMILNFQKPIAGAVNCSVPFLLGDRFLISLPPPSGLPPLPHGRAIISVCRLLGAEGLNYVISAVLTECKILFHSQDIADIAMVAEVISALTYPFVWSLPYIPILPLGMLEFVEAPLSYILGIPTCNLKQIDPRALDDVVVIDLNNEFSSIDHHHSRRQSKPGTNKHPTPLPAKVATNLSKALYKLLRLEEEMEEELGSADLGEQILPRLESESLAEREFRVAIAIEICGLLRGYQDCVGTVFNRDKFLKTAPALFEDRRENKSAGGSLGVRNGSSGQNKVLSARSKRFLSLLVNGQNFQQLLESLESPQASFFHEIMELIDDSASESKPHIAMRASSSENGNSKAERNIQHLMKSLQQKEDKIPTYMVKKGAGLNGENMDEHFLFDVGFDDFDDFDINGEFLSSEDRNISSFTTKILAPVESDSATVESSEPGKQSLSMEYLAKLEETPWDYQSLFKIPIGGDGSHETIIDINKKVKLRDAIGERRFRAWKSSQDQKPGEDADLAFLPESARAAAHGAALNLTSLVTSAKNDDSDTMSLSAGRSSLRTPMVSPEQQKVADAKSRDIIRRCLDKAQGAVNSTADPSEIFKEKSRDLMAEAEKALRNPSAQLFLLKILAQRSRLESQGVRSIRRQSVVANSASRLDPVAFNCLVRLSCAMLDSCMEFMEFEPAYRLLTNTAGFIMVVESDNEESENGEIHRSVVTMTSRVGLHPIFADLGVWEAVMKLHLRDRKSARKTEDSRIGQDEESGDEEDDEIEYEAAVATLYEMVGYGIPGEELSRFAMRASEENGWFCDDRGRQLLMLARRISIRRDQAEFGGTGEASDIDMVRKGPEASETAAAVVDSDFTDEQHEFAWKEVGWCHPAAPSARVLAGGSIHSESGHAAASDDLMKRSAVTALASFGTSLVVSGGLDGGVFLAHSVNDDLRTKVGVDEAGTPKVRGVHLDWGSASRAGTGTSSDGEYGVGAVSCLAAAYGGGHHSHNIATTKDVGGRSDESDFLDSMEGSRIVAGTTAGDLRVWSVKDIYSAILAAKNKEDSNSTRLKFSLRGRALSGHRGGVTCIDVPSQVYRPDSLVSGGADGLIKLWSLRAPSSSRRSSTESDAGGNSAGQQRGRGGDALSTLSDHIGRILCIQTAWHGDHLLSGGADMTIRLWDLASGGGKSLHTLCGHFGWVTNVKYWGPNTIVSASTDRSVALWDARVRGSPLFILRHHLSPISDLLVGSRTDPFMISSGTDGSIATWDFRMLSETGSTHQHHHAGNKKDASRACTVVREPSASMVHSPTAAGPTLLARSVKDPMRSFLSVGSDAILREWNVVSGEMLDESPTGHCDAISSFESFAVSSGFASSSTSVAASLIDNPDAPFHKGTLTSSLDGTIRMRKLVRQQIEQD
jgi:WD40 repeat protein